MGTAHSGDRALTLDETLGVWATRAWASKRPGGPLAIGESRVIGWGAVKTDDPSIVGIFRLASYSVRDHDQLPEAGQSGRLGSSFAADSPASDRWPCEQTGDARRGLFVEGHPEPDRPPSDGPMVLGLDSVPSPLGRVGRAGGWPSSPAGSSG